MKGTIIFPCHCEMGMTGEEEEFNVKQRETTSLVLSERLQVKVFQSFHHRPFICISMSALGSA